MQAVILAGGLGTRLQKIVSDRPKALVQVGGKAFLEYQLEFLERYSVREVILCTGYLGEKIVEHFLDKEPRMKIIFSQEQKQLGTGGALKNAKDLLDAEFFVLNGDTIFLTDLFDMNKFHKENSANLTVALTRVNDQSQYGSVNLDNAGLSHKGSKVVSFHEKSNSVGQAINAGVYLVEKRVLTWNGLPEAFSWENDFLPSAIKKWKIFGFLDKQAYFVDIGTIKGYRKFETDLRSGKTKGYR